MTMMKLLLLVLVKE